MKIKNFEQLEQLAGSSQSRIGVVMADDDHILLAVKQAMQRKLIRPVLIGDCNRIASIWQGLGCNLDDADFESASSAEASSVLAAELVRQGKLDGIMKGHLETGVLMKALVNREHGITAGKVMSLLAMMYSPYYQKLFGVTDVGLLTYPTLEQKVAEIQNAVSFFRDLGVDKPKVAVLCAVEKPNAKMQDTLDAQQLAQMGQNNLFGPCIVEGPISYDLAMMPEAAQLKGYEGNIQGDADILVVPNIVTGNVLAKALTCTGGAQTGGIVIGGKVPVILVSRSASIQDKYHAILLMAAKKALQQKTQ